MGCETMRTMIRIVLVISVLFLPAALWARPVDKKVIEASMQRAMDVFQAPGLAVSVVHEGKVVYRPG